MIQPAILFTNIRQLLTLRGSARARRGAELRELAIVEDAAVLCAGGKIVSVGTRAEAKRDAWLKQADRAVEGQKGRRAAKGQGARTSAPARQQEVRELDCGGGVMLPGFVDAHTHPAFATPRLADFEKRIAGATYEEIAAAGGGIRSSAEGVRMASHRALVEKIRDALGRMAAQGTTTLEAKSGYGLSVEAEIKSLEAIGDAARSWPGTVASTLLGAHVVPHEFKDRADEYVRVVQEEMIPAVGKRKLAQFVDVFVERGAFTLEQAEQICSAAIRHGLRVRAHVGQLTHTTIAALLALRPASLDHLDHIEEADIRELALSETVATLVPGSNYFLGLREYPPARKLIDAGAAVALATDYNPGTSPTVSMPMVLSMACTQMRMSPEEAIAAATINGAASLGLAERKGSVEPGKDADLALFAVQDYREIPYWFGENLCTGVVIGGEIGKTEGRASVWPDE